MHSTCALVLRSNIYILVQMCGTKSAHNKRTRLHLPLGEVLGLARGKGANASRLKLVLLLMLLFLKLIFAIDAFMYVCVRAFSDGGYEQ